MMGVGRALLGSLGVLLGLTGLIHVLGVDVGLADFWYALEGNHWAWREAWWASVLVHQWAKYFSGLLLFVVLGLCVGSYCWSRLKPWRGVLLYVAVSFVLSTLLVSELKVLSDVSCPWDFSRYGGALDYVPLLEQLVLRNGHNCFPAGHASTGFAWVCLYFVGVLKHSPWRWAGLGFALLFGGLCGVSQQLRGAHFLSHDVWSFGVCWLVALVGYYGGEIARFWPSGYSSIRTHDGLNQATRPFSRM